MKIIFLAVLLFVALSTASKMCRSTGDPHYVTFGKQKYDLYGAEGDYILAKAGDFEVQTRIEFGRFWGKQGINTAVAVRYGKSFFEVYADYYEINNKKNASLDTAGGLNIAFDAAKNSYTISTPRGERVIINRGNGCSRTGGDLTKPCLSFDVYVHGNTSIEYDGLCKGICSDPKVAQQWRVESTAKNNLFHVKIIRERYFSDEPWTPPKWKDEKTKNLVTKFCKSLGLPEDVVEECIIDGMIYGGIPVGYRRFNDSVNRIKRKCIQFAQKARKHCTKWATQKATQTRCVKKANAPKKCKTTKVCVLKKVCVTKKGNKVVKKTSKCAKYKKVRRCNKGGQRCVKRLKRTYNVKKCKQYGNKIYRVCTKWA